LPHEGALTEQLTLAEQADDDLAPRACHRCEPDDPGDDEEQARGSVALPDDDFAVREPAGRPRGRDRDRNPHGPDPSVHRRHDPGGDGVDFLRVGSRHRGEGGEVPKRERDALAQVPLFSSLSARHLRRIADLTEQQRYMEGARVVRHDDVGDTFYVILEGEAKVVGPSGRTVNRLRPGEFFGEISLLDGGPRTADVVAATPLTMLALSRTNFLTVLRSEPVVAVTLLGYAASLLRRIERSTLG
jgi:hypothetical protein